MWKGGCECTACTPTAQPTQRGVELHCFLPPLSPADTRFARRLTQRSCPNGGDPSWACVHPHGTFHPYRYQPTPCPLSLPNHATREIHASFHKHLDSGVKVDNQGGWVAHGNGLLITMPGSVGSTRGANTRFGAARRRAITYFSESD
jgi:hypothetical protein